MKKEREAAILSCVIILGDVGYNYLVYCTLQYVQHVLNIAYPTT